MTTTLASSMFIPLCTAAQATYKLHFGIFPTLKARDWISEGLHLKVSHLEKEQMQNSPSIATNNSTLAICMSM